MANTRTEFRDGLRAFARSLKKMGKDTQKIVRQELWEVGRKARERAAHLTPVDTGETRESWAIQPLHKGIAFRVFNNSERAHAPIALESGGTTSLIEILEFGSDRHLITPKAKKALAFFWEKENVNWVGPQVNHPGT